ncbi:4-hydroxybenzoate polyprenyltransferase-like prenyltransferase [Synechococcus sp. PCC 7502]|uniref:homogentisate phytyltransferase n=1 Tax=Synechococcus sp. PCC 7502 TaxID=1173263 RepID=UPI00029F9666|nr:homogentisate phytyltransferase [Synechococcus sp. PCC 7502]AFY74684.1 4-hydroxybenzoate polyprenyltransferase-like prenyltransferase [Synechococcus sp. PCC 7502]
MLKNKLSALWQFSRPHTIIGTSLSVTALYLMAASSGASIANSALIWLSAAIACICANIYIVGLNQITDVAIDKINKPQLPLAAGDFTVKQGWLIVITCLLWAIALALAGGKFLLLTVTLSLIIGTIYSQPPIRLKRFPFWASMCIFSVRGLVVNIGLFLHFNYSLNNSLDIPLKLWLLTIFILIFTYVIAIFKDMPDIEGDRQFNIATLSIQWGQLSVFNLSRQILLSLYTIITIISITSWLTDFSININNLVLIVTHGILVVVFWQRSIIVNLSDRQEITQFYQFIWKLFYLEYIIFPLANIIQFIN